MTAEALKVLFDVSAVILLFLTFAAGVGVLITGNVINKRQEAQLRQFDKDLKDKDLKISEVQRDAKEADAKIAAAQRGAEEARTTAKGFESKIADSDARVKSAEAQVATAMAASDDAVARVKTADARIAEAQRGAAEANRIAEQERLARLQLEARLADRILTPEQQRRLIGGLSPFKGKTIDVSVFGETLEIAVFSGAILNSLRQAGLLINTSNPMGGGSAARGILIGVKPGSPSEFSQIANVLIGLLRESVGNAVRMYDFDKLTVGGMMTGVSQAKGAEKLGETPIRLFIGSK